MQHYFSKDKINNNFVLSDSDWHHIKNVMRMNNEDKIVVIYEGFKYLCSINVEQGIVSMINKIIERDKTGVKVSIAQGLIREQKLDTVLKMCTELGMSEYYPVVMERSVVKLERQVYKKKVDRWQLICKEAAEQSHRNDMPIIKEIIDVDGLSELDYDVKLVCSTKENLTNIKNILQNSRNCDKMLIVVGPEGGISQGEEQLLNEKGFISVSLGSKILRTETAPVYVNSVINYDLVE